MCVRVTFDIPDEIYRALEHLASIQGKSIDQVVLDRLASAALPIPAKTFSVPILQPKREDRINLDGEDIYRLVGFP